MRRNRILLLLTVLALVATGCGGNEDAAGEPDGTDAPITGAAEVEVFSWWTAGGEAEGLEAMIGVFNDLYPEYDFVNAAVAGGAGTNARAVLASRLSANDPPSSWQGHAGQELIGTYVAAGPARRSQLPVRGGGLARRHARHPHPADLRGRRDLLRPGEHPPRERAVVPAVDARERRRRGPDDLGRVPGGRRDARGRRHHAAGDG
jgi:hypothetical protein